MDSAKEYLIAWADGGPCQRASHSCSHLPARSCLRSPVSQDVLRPPILLALGVTVVVAKEYLSAAVTFLILVLGKGTLTCTFKKIVIDIIYRRMNVLYVQ